MARIGVRVRVRVNDRVRLRLRFRFPLRSGLVVKDGFGLAFRLGSEWPLEA